MDAKQSVFSFENEADDVKRDRFGLTEEERRRIFDIKEGEEPYGEIQGVVHLDGKRIGLVKSMRVRSDSKNEIIELDIIPVPKDTKLITPQQAYCQGLITEDEYLELQKGASKGIEDEQNSVFTGLHGEDSRDGQGSP